MTLNISSNVRTLTFFFFLNAPSSHFPECLTSRVRLQEKRSTSYLVFNRLSSVKPGSLDGNVAVLKFSSNAFKTFVFWLHQSASLWLATHSYASGFPFNFSCVSQ